MSQELIDNMIAKNGYKTIDKNNLDEFCAKSGEKIIALMGNPERNLETADMAIILPEINKAFQNIFEIGVVEDNSSRLISEKFEVWPTPSLIFLRDENHIGTIAKVQNWDEYVNKIKTFLLQDTNIN